MSSPNPYSPKAPTPNSFRAISRNNSNASTASSSNKGDMSSTISTANSATSNRSQLSKHQQLLDHRHLFASCGSQTPIRSFQRATISSVVKTRAFDNNPVLQGLLVTPASSQNSASNSPNPSPHTTPVFSRSRSLRMSGGSYRYPQSPSYFRNSSRTPELNSFNSGDISNCSIESQTKVMELSKEKAELQESLEFLECERQVLIDSSKDLKDALQSERSHWKDKVDDLMKEVTELMAARVKAESLLSRNEMEMYDLKQQVKRLNDDLLVKDRHLETFKNDYNLLLKENKELKLMLSERLNLNGSQQSFDGNGQQVSNDVSIIEEIARLRLEIRERDDTIKRFSSIKSTQGLDPAMNLDMENLNKFLDRTVECIKGWPEELAGSSHVQNLMKTLLSAYRVDQNELCLKLESINL